MAESTAPRRTMGPGGTLGSAPIYLSSKNSLGKSV